MADSPDPVLLTVWQVDPADTATMRRSLPDPARIPLFDFSPNPAAAPGEHAIGSYEFRYWTAVEALRRGADLWQSILDPIGVVWAWNVQPPGSALPVRLDVDEELNATYDRQALKFYHGPTASGPVYSGESPDILCHELGHAVLDAIKPDLYHAASNEAAAFHEAFGDISAMLTAIRLPAFCTAVLAETHGRLYTNSRLSRIAQQMGTAIRAENPQAVDADCVRNAVNRFIYADPLQLPHSAPATQLASEPHSFSRVFSGAFLEALAALLTAAAHPARPDEAQLNDCAARLATLLIKSVLAAPVVSNFMPQVAAGMVALADAADAAVLRAVFTARSLLSLESSMEVSRLSGARVAPDHSAPPHLVAIDARHLGLDKPLLVQPPGEPRGFEVRASATDAGSIEPTSGLIAARSFADDLVRRGRVRFTPHAGQTPKLQRPGRFVTHEIDASDPSADAVHLRRICFDCGLNHS